MLTSIVLISLICIASSHWSQCPDKYRRYSNQHSFCLPPCCSCPYVKAGISEELKQTILWYHNSFRSKIASGDSGVDHIPTATNMLEMVWDDELAVIAQNWVNTCSKTFECRLCRMVERFPVDQILIEVSGPMTTRIIQEEFLSNLNKLRHVTKYELSNYHVIDRKKILTHLLWAKTWRLGCGALYYRGENSFDFSRLVCNYGPAGNIEGEEVYEDGATCSACPGNSCCGKGCEKHKIKARYKGLCKVIDENKSPQGDFPVNKTENQVFYCSFNGESDCSYEVEGENVWSIKRSTGGARLSAVLKSGWRTTLHFTSPLKSKFGQVCIRIVTRKGSLSPDNEYNYEMSGKVQTEGGYMRPVVFPKVDQNMRHMYEVDYIQPYGYPKMENVTLSVSFSVPNRTSPQYFEVHEITAEEKKCKHITTDDVVEYYLP